MASCAETYFACVPGIFSSVFTHIPVGMLDAMLDNPKRGGFPGLVKEVHFRPGELDGDPAPVHITPTLSYEYGWSYIVDD